MEGITNVTLTADSDRRPDKTRNGVTSTRDAKWLGNRLEERVVVDVFPHLARGFLRDRRRRLGRSNRPSEKELRDIHNATLTLLYRLLFLLYAESRDALRVGETAHRGESLQQIKEQIAAQAGEAEPDAPGRLEAYSETSAALYDRFLKLCTALTKGDSTLNVPRCMNGLFIVEPNRSRTDVPSVRQSHKHRIATFLRGHKVPDRYLALAIDRLARDTDARVLDLVFIDYKSLDVRHLGGIHEGLLEFKLRIAVEDLTTETEKKVEKYIPLSRVRPSRGRRRMTPEVVVRKGEVYLSNDKAERKATGSYYTPEAVVQHIIGQSVGPVLDQKLATLGPDFDKAAETYDRHLKNAKDNPARLPRGIDARSHAATETYTAHHDLVDKVFDLKVLDPAMGSGHFLVEAVRFITDRLLAFLHRYPHDPVRLMLDKTRRDIEQALRGMSVDVDTKTKLTDINLLKRHVLERCIYGVDLDPTAVELAKVSLWLDTFTPGVPVRVFDHHLRCGNSLVGATFADLRQAASGQSFAKDHEPPMAAIRRILLLNETTDATAAGVRRSDTEYAQARNELTGAQAMLDSLVADQFAVQRPRRTQVGRGGQQPRRVVETLARRPDLRFFHWETEFPEVFFGFADAERRRIKHKNDIEPGSAGFDAVVGNPPYLSFSGRQARHLCPESRRYYSKRFGAEGWPTLHGYFVRRAIELSRGTVSLIVPDQVAHLDGYAPLRRWGVQHAHLREVRYWGEAVFGKVVTPALTFTAARSGQGETSIVPVQGQGVRVSIRDSDPWVAPSAGRNLLVKLASQSRGLGDLVADPGVHTGNCSRRLIVRREAAPPDAVPVLEGRQVGKYRCDAPTKRLRLDYKTKAGEYFTIRPVERYRDARFVIRQTARYPIVGPRRNAEYFRNSLLALYAPRDGTDVRYLVGLLNSRLMRFAHEQGVQEAKQRAFPQVKVRSLRALPIRWPDWADSRERSRHDRLVRLVQQNLDLHSRRQRAGRKSQRNTIDNEIDEVARQIDRLVYCVYGLDAAEVDLVEGATAQTDGAIARSLRLCEMDTRGAT